MRFFINKFILYFLTFSFTIILILYAYKPKWSIGIEVQDVIDLLDEISDEDKIDTFRLGDSVGKNLIGTSRTANTLNLGSNQAITILGQLLFFNKFLSNYKGEIPKIEFEGFIKPKSFYSGLNQKFTFNYFIKFFYNNDWFFNSQILSKQSSDIINQELLSSYKYCDLIRYTYCNGFTIFSYPRFGNTNLKFPVQKKSLLDLIKSEDLTAFKNKIKFLSMPVHKINYDSELEAFKNLQRMGFNIERPFILHDSFFIEDKIHLKPKYRNYGFYKSISKFN